MKSSIELRAGIAAMIATALGVAVAACGSSSQKPANSAAAGASNSAEEKEYKEPPALREASCGGGH